MEIIKRAESGGEIVSWNEDVRDEAIHRNARAGYCNSDGSPVGPRKIVSKPSDENYRKNYRRIFRHD